MTIPLLAISRRVLINGHKRMKRVALFIGLDKKCITNVLIAPQ